MVQVVSSFVRADAARRPLGVAIGVGRAICDHCVGKNRLADRDALLHEYMAETDAEDAEQDASGR